MNYELYRLASLLPNYYIQEVNGGVFILRVRGRASLEERMVAFCTSDVAACAVLRLLAL